MRVNIKNGLTGPECAKFRRDCNFSDEELAVFDLRVKNLSVVEIQQRLIDRNLPMSEATIWRRLRSIQSKIKRINHLTDS